MCEGVGLRGMQTGRLKHFFFFFLLSLYTTLFIQLLFCIFSFGSSSTAGCKSDGGYVKCCSVGVICLVHSARGEFPIPDLF